jgi:hypothetical protein
MNTTQTDPVPVPVVDESSIPDDICHLMLDLETLSTCRQACVISVGAVILTRTRILSRYYAIIQDVDAQFTLGAVSRPSTALWWMQQSEAARQQFTEEHKVATIDVLHVIKGFMSRCQTIWGNGGDFDPPILENLYRIYGMAPPWGHRAIRCFRTHKSEWPEVYVDRPEIAHSAVDDALAQAKTLIRIWNYIDRLKASACKAS